MNFVAYLLQTDPPGTPVIKLEAKLYPSSTGHLYYYISDQGTLQTNRTNEFVLDSTTGDLKNSCSTQLRHSERLFGNAAHFRLI